jgi:hypothetical protein
MQSLFLMLALCTAPLFAQDQEEEPALLVLRILSDTTWQNNPQTKDHLSTHSWESLAYWDSDMPSDKENLFEAVPDVYRFDEGTFRLRLFKEDQTSNQTITGKYRLNNENLIFLNETGNKELDKWKIIYLDKNYLAVDMQGLRVFLVSPDDDPF